MKMQNYNRQYNCNNAVVLSQTNPKSVIKMPEVEEPREQQSLSESSQLRRYLSRRAQCSDEAADIYQESVVRVLEQAKKSPISNPIAYAISIAKNLLSQRTPHNDDGIEELSTTQTNPELNLQRTQKLELIYQALERMPEQRRRVFELRRLHGENRESIANQLNISSETVTRHISRAMVDIQRYLDEKIK